MNGAEEGTEETSVNNGQRKEDDQRQEEKQSQKNQVPVDTGWAWVIAFAIFLNMTIIVGHNRALSVLFVDIVQEFQEPNTVITLMFTVHALSGSLSSILIANLAMKRFNVRIITVVSALVNGIMSIFISFAPNIVVFLLLFLIKGITFGGLMVCPMSMIGFYFKKRRALASSIGNAGFCIAYIAFPPITELLRQEFGFRGALLLIAGVELQLVAFNMLLRPVDSYNKNIRTSKVKKRVEDETRLPALYKGPMGDTAGHSQPLIGQPTSRDLKPCGTAGNGLVLVPVEETGTHSLEIDQELSEYDGSEGGIKQEISRTDLSQNKDIIEDATFVKTTASKDPEDINEENNTVAVLPFSSLRNVLAASGQTSSDEEACDRTRLSDRQLYTSQLSVISQADLPCILPAQSDVDDAMVRKESKCQFSAFIDLSLFKLWKFRMMAVFVTFGVFGNYLSIYMPTIAFKFGISKPDAALFMTVSGIMDLVTRIVTGVIADFKFVSKIKLVLVSKLIICSICQCARFFNTYTLFIVFAVLVGIFGGFRQNFTNVILLDYFGPENMAKANGLIMTIATMTLSINHPILGAMLDATGSFIVPLHYIGIMCFLSAITLSMEPIFSRLDDHLKTLSEMKTGQDAAEDGLLNSDVIKTIKRH